MNFKYVSLTLLYDFKLAIAKMDDDDDAKNLIWKDQIA